MQLTCRQCGEPLHGRDVDYASLRASCRSCGWQLGGGQQGIYRKADAPRDDTPEVPSATAPAAALTPPRPRLPLPPLPEFITIEQTPGIERLDVEVREPRKWRFYLIVAAFALRFSPLLYAGKASWWMLGMFVVLVWIFGAWLANTRRLRVARGELEVSYWPFPRPAKRIDIVDLDQLWVDEQINRGDKTYRLRARLRSGKDVTLVDQLPEPVGALHLERRIEDLLGIIDRPIDDEIV